MTSYCKYCNQEIELDRGLWVLLGENNAMICELKVNNTIRKIDIQFHEPIEKPENFNNLYEKLRG